MADAKISALTAGTPLSTDILPYTDLVGGTTKKTTVAALGSGLNLSGTNTGDQDLSGLVPKTTTVNGHALLGNVAVTAADVGAPSGSGTSTGSNTGDKTITLTGDVTGSGTGSFAATLANTAVTPGSYTSANVTIDAKGRITAATNGTGGGTPGGTTGAIQYNNGSGFGGANLNGLVFAHAALHPTVAVAGIDYQAPLTNPVTGTGTSGQVSYWNGSATQSGNTNFRYDVTNKRLNVGSTAWDGTNPETIRADSGVTTSVNCIDGNGSINNYLQNNISNASNGTGASSDIVATADNGSETTNYVDLGINGSAYTGGVMGIANDAYLYNVGQDFNIGTGTAAKVLNFLTGGTDKSVNKRFTISDSAISSTVAMSINGKNVTTDDVALSYALIFG